jgi:hypothetical protein
VSRMNQYRRLPSSLDLLFKFNAPEGRPIHAPLCHGTCLLDTQFV